MKILHVVRQFHPSVGGIERAVHALCHHLQRRGHVCPVVTLDRLWDDPRRLPPAGDVDGLRIERIPFVGGRRFFLAPGVLRTLGDHSIIHIHGIDFFVDFLAATRWCHRKSLVVSTHGGFFHTPWAMAAKRVYFQTITRLALTQVDRVICTSAQDDRLFAPIVPAGKRVTIGNGVADDLFQVWKSVDPGLLLMVGRITAHKRIDRVIGLLPRIRREVPWAHLVVAGPDGEGLRASLEARARAGGVADAVAFAGTLAPEGLRAALSHAHLVLAPSEYEGFGIAVLEAMATGSLVIGNEIDAFRELIQPGSNGLLVDFADEGSALRTVVRALQLPMPEVRALGDQARAAAARFAWDRVVDQVEQVYLASAAGRGNP